MLDYGVYDVPMSPRHSIGFTLLLVIGAALLIVLAKLTFNVDASASDVLAQTHTLPPSFGTSRVFYALILALVLTMSGLAAGAMIEDARFLLTFPGKWNEPAKTTVFNEMLLLGAVFISVFPDAVVLMAWGELMAPTNSFLSKLDRTLDGVSALLFLAWALRRQRTRPVVLFQLQRQPYKLDLAPTWAQLRPKVMIAVVIMVISFGVAFGK